MDWMRLERALTAWSAWYRPRLRLMGAAMPGGFYHEEQSLYEALDCRVEDLKLTERVDALERLAVVAARVCEGRSGGYWTEMREILDELGRRSR